MTLTEERQNSIEAAYAARERWAEYSERFQVTDQAPAWEPTQVRPGVLPLPQRASFAVTVVRIINERPHRHKLSVLAWDRDEAEWCALAYFRGPHQAHIGSAP